MKNKLAFLSLPYSSNKETAEERKAETAERIRIMALCDAWLMKQDYFTISPCYKHLMREYVPEMPGDWAYWGEYSVQLLRRCDVMFIIMMPGWENSVGVRGEIESSIKEGIPVRFIVVQRTDDAFEFGFMG